MEVKITTAGQTINAQIKLPRRTLLTMVTVVSTAIGSLLYHVRDTNIQFAIVKDSLAKCERRVAELEKTNQNILDQLKLPGNNPGGIGTGPPREP